MMSIARLYCLLLLIVVTSFSVYANKHAISVDSDDFRLPIQQYHQLSPALSDASINQVSSSNAQWQLQQHSSVFLSQGNTWISSDVSNSETVDIDSYLVIRNSILLADVKVYLQLSNNVIEPLALKLHRNNLWVAKFSIPAHQQLTLFYQFKTDSEVNLPLVLMSADTFFQELSHSYFYTGTAIGGLLFLALLAVIVFFSNGYKTVLLLCAYFITSALLLSVLLGGNLFLIWPHLQALRGLELPVLVAANSAFFVWFSMELFQIKKQHKTLFKHLRKYCWLLLLYMPLSMQLGMMTNIYVSYAIHIATNIALLIAGVQFLKQGHRLAYLYSAIIAMQLLIGLINLLSSQLSGDSFFSQTFVLYSVSFWVTACLMSFLISRQYYYQVKDKQQAQLQALEAATATKQAQEELLTLQQDAQEQLESRVQERTLELNIALQELEEVNRELAQKSTIDDLTGLFNRRHYDQKILAEYRRSKRNLTPLSLIIVDIDHFKSVNDNYGHLTGDQCISAVGRLIKQCLRRGSDLGFRYGGEEFCLILPETDVNGAKALAEELRSLVSATAIDCQQQQLAITISCGVFTYQQQPSIDPDKLFSMADQALYRAKENGRNQVQVEALAENVTHQEQINE